MYFVLCPAISIHSFRRYIMSQYLQNRTYYLETNGPQKPTQTYISVVFKTYHFISQLGEFEIQRCTAGDISTPVIGLKLKFGHDSHASVFEHVHGFDQWLRQFIVNPITINFISKFTLKEKRAKNEWWKWVIFEGLCGLLSHNTHNTKTKWVFSESTNGDKRVLLLC